MWHPRSNTAVPVLTSPYNGHPILPHPSATPISSYIHSDPQLISNLSLSHPLLKLSELTGGVDGLRRGRDPERRVLKKLPSRREVLQMVEVQRERAEREEEEQYEQLLKRAKALGLDAEDAGEANRVA